MGETFAELVTDGPLLVAAAVAALVGLISFASPCVLPLVPGYLSYVTGLVGSGATASRPSGSGGTATAVRTEIPPRARMVLGAVLFNALLLMIVGALLKVVRPRIYDDTRVSQIEFEAEVSGFGEVMRRVRGKTA